jgi:outer membrane protein assembly factor BamB
MDEQAKLTKQEKNMIGLLRGSSDSAVINPAFQKQLKSKLMASHKPVHVQQGFFIRHRFMFSMAATVALLFPIIVAFVLLRPRQNLFPSESKSTAVAADTNNAIQNTDFKALRVEFSNALNQKSQDMINTALAEQVTLTINGTSCCGQLAHDDAVTELLFQLKDKQSYNFDDPQVAVIKAQNPQFSDYQIGVEGSDVIAFALDQNLDVDRIVLANLNELIKENSTRIINSFEERLNAGDYQGVKQLLAPEVKVQVQSQNCCGEIDNTSASNKLRQQIANVLPIDFGSSKITDVKQDNDFLEGYVLGVNRKNKVIGFTLNSIDQIDAIFIGSTDDLIVQTSGQVCTAAESNQTPLLQNNLSRNNSSDLNIVSSNPKILWTKDYRPSAAELVQPVIYNQQIYLVGGGSIYNSDGDGNIGTFVVNSADRFSSPTIENDVMYMASDNYLTAVSVSDGKQLWKISDPSEDSTLTFAAPVHGCGLVIYSSSREGGDQNYITAVDDKTGKRRWVQRSGFHTAAPLAYSDQTIYVVDYASNLYALNISDGSVKWRVTLEQKGSTGIVISDDKLLIGTNDNHLLAVDRNSGRLIWSIDTGSAVMNLPVAQSDRVYVTTLNAELAAYSLNNGDLLWSVKLTDFASQPAVFNGQVVMALNSGELVSIEGASGKQNWEVKISSVITGYSQPIIIGNRIFISADNHQLISLQ